MYKRICQGLWVYARDQSIQKRRKHHFCSLNSCTECSNTMIYPKVHECVKDMFIWNRKMTVFGWQFKNITGDIWYLLHKTNKHDHSPELLSILLYHDYGVGLNSLIMWTTKVVMARMLIDVPRLKQLPVYTSFRLCTLGARSYVSEIHLIPIWPLLIYLLL